MFNRELAKMGIRMGTRPADVLYVTTNTYNQLIQDTKLEMRELKLNSTNIMSDKNPILELLDTMVCNMYGS